MSKNTHAGTVRNGMVHTLCGKSFPASGNKKWVFWGTCPDCAKILKRRRKK